MPEKESDNCSNDERQARSVALEKAYVHDVYDQIAPHFTDNRYRAWPRVKQFLMDLEPGSLVADIGCGNGKYLDINNQIYKIGLDHCALLTHIARRRRYEVLVCDNLQLPFRDESFDAALSVAVVHHFATTERRVQALRELARILRIGGRVMITVWAMEQRHRKFESQDVLVPWHRPEKSSSDDRGSSAERDVTSTTTSDDDILIYQAYNQTSDSDVNGSCGRQTPDSRVARRRQLFRDTRGCHKGHSFDTASNQNSNEMAGPGETCYSFVKRALQKLSNPGGSYMRRQSYFYRKCRASWFSDSLESDTGEEGHIELRHLEEDPPEERRVQPPQQQSSGYSFKSLSDLFSLIPNILRARKSEVKEENRGKRVSTASDPREYARKPGPSLNGIVRSRSTACCMFQYENYQSDDQTNKAPNSLTSSDIANGNCIVERQLSQQTAVESPSDEEPSENVEQASLQTENKPVLDSISSGSHLAEVLFAREEEEGRLVSYWSMPELRSISTETSEEQSDSKAEIEEENISATDGGSSSSRKSSREDDNAFIGSDKGIDEDDKNKTGSLRNGFVKRSLSIDIAVPKTCPTEQRRYSSSSEQPGGQTAPCPSPRWYSLKSETSIESDAMSVVQWKGQSLQSDTSVDSDESIVSVIYRSPSEVEALARRARRGSRSLQASPLTIAPSRGGSVEAPSDAGDLAINKGLAKYLDAECTEVGEIIGEFHPMDLRSKLQQGMLKSKRSRSTSVDLDFRSESKVLGSKDLRRSSLPCPMYVRKSLEIEEEEEDEDSKNDSTEVFVAKSDDDSSKSTFRRLCRSEPVDLSEDDMDNITDDDDEDNENEGKTDRIANKELLSKKIEDYMEEEMKIEPPTSVKLKNEENNNCRKPVGILKYCYRASSLEERSPKRIGLPRRSLSDASDPLPPIQEINSPRVRLCLEERPRGGCSIPRLNPTLTWQFSPNVPDIMRQEDKESNSEEDIDLLQPDQITSGFSPSSEEKDSSARRSFRQSSEEFDTSSVQLSRQSSTTSEDYSDLHRHYFVDKNAIELMREDSSEPSLPLQETMNRSDSSDQKSSFVRESSEEHNQEESFDHDVSSVTASVGSKDTEEDIHRQPTKRSRSTDGSDVDLMHTSATSIPEHSFGKLEILPVPDDPCLESYDVNEWTARNCTNQDHLSRNTSLSLSTSQESLVGNESGGLMTYHRYYHVFREGELDHLIETQVENLHIISSYYDHANWCVVAEKVRVWTI